MHFCLIISITEHPAFTRARALRFRHDGAGNIIARTEWGDEHLSHADAHDQMRVLKATAQNLRATGDEFAAAQALSDLRELEAAWLDLRTFWRVAS